MSHTQSLVAGFSAYAQASELSALTGAAAPAATPSTVSVFLTASSPECVAFSIGASAGAVTSTGVTITAGC